MQNELATVEAVRQEYPRAWSKCHKPGDPEAWDFIILLGRRLHAKDPHYGCNGKRGSSDINDLSWDAVNYKKDGKVTVIDVVSAAGSSAASPAWQIVDNNGFWWNPNELKVHYPYDVEPKPVPEPKPEPVPEINNLIKELISLQKVNNDLVSVLINSITLHTDYVQNVQEDKINQILAQLENRNVQYKLLLDRLNGRFKIGF